MVLLRTAWIRDPNGKHTSRGADFRLPLQPMSIIGLRWRRGLCSEGLDGNGS